MNLPYAAYIAAKHGPGCVVNFLVWMLAGLLAFFAVMTAIGITLLIVDWRFVLVYIIVLVIYTLWVNHDDRKSKKKLPSAPAK